MVANQQKLYISPQDYLAGERVSPIKHEYRRGHVYALREFKIPHAVIAGNLNQLLNKHLEQTTCLVLLSNIKVRLDQADCYYYPDVVVTCDRRDLSTTEDFILYPKLVLEVLSDSTAAFDRGDKFADYQTCETLQEYVLVNQSKQQVECLRLTEQGWLVRFMTRKQKSPLSALS
jgi:Uma2 family endonuclease